MLNERAGGDCEVEEEGWEALPERFSHKEGRQAAARQCRGCRVKECTAGEIRHWACPVGWKTARGPF